MLENEDTIINNTKISCTYCNYTCYQEGMWLRHIKSKKHIYAEKKNKNKLNICEKCNKIYKNIKCFEDHKKKCKNNNQKLENIFEYRSPLDISLNKTNIYIPENSKINIEEYLNKQDNEILNITENTITEIMHCILVQNNHLKKLVLQHIEKNKKNIEYYKSGKHLLPDDMLDDKLKEFFYIKCKDAMTLIEFINQIELDIGHVDILTKMGYDDALTNIITTEINKIDLYKRPFHCIDEENETIYVKINGEWIRDIDKEHINNLIDFMFQKIMNMVPEWRKTHPASSIYETIFEEQYIEFLKEMNKKQMEDYY